MVYIFFGVTCFIFIGSILGYKHLLNPIALYNILWGGIVGLYLFRITPLQDNLSDYTFFVFTVVSIIFSFMTFLSYNLGCFTARVTRKSILSKSSLNNYFIVWVCIEVIEVVWSGGLPVIWKIINNGKTYFDFGIPSVHGFANALGLALSTILFYHYLKNKDKKSLFKVFVMCIFYLSLITRQVIISMFIQMFVVYCIYKDNIPWKRLLYYAMLGIICFGIVGNFRTGYTEFLSVSQIDTDINPLFVGIYWVYMYLTMSIANLNMILSSSVSFDAPGTIHLASVYAPSFIRNIFFSARSYELPNYLVTQAFNVSGYFMDFYLAYKEIGIVIISGIYGTVSGLLYRKIRKQKSEINIVYYSICIQILLLSFFYNHLLYLPSGFQFLIIWFMSKKIKFVH